MKPIRFLYMLFAVVVLSTSCKKDEIDTYSGGTYIQFTRGFNDSSLFSFLGLPDDDEATVPISVRMTGQPENRDRTFKISAVPALTTATAAHYTLPTTFTLRANRVTDTAWITVKKTPDLSVKSVKLVMKMEETDDFQIGQTDHAAIILYISNVVARPDWWDSNVEGRYLGSYSDKKLLLFIQLTGISELDPDNDNEVHYYTLILKNHLLREKDAGRTVYEENGAEMTVALIGG